MKLLRKLAHEEHRTIITVLHDITCVSGYADPMVTLLDTRLNAIGATEQSVDAAVMRGVLGTDAQVHMIEVLPVVRVQEFEVAWVRF